MSADAMYSAKRAGKGKPYRSGHCSRTNPSAIHEQCRGGYDRKTLPIGWVACSCDCHTIPEAAAVDHHAVVSGQAAGEVLPVPCSAVEASPPQVLPLGPGFHRGIPEDEYHAHPASLSVSGAKVLLKAPALFDYQRRNPVHKDVFDFGSAAHALVLGVGMESIYVAPFDNWKTKAAQDEKRIAQEDGLSPILPADWAKVCDMADVLSQHRLAMRLLSEGEAEVSAFCLDEPTGVMRRARFDWLGPRVIVDYKSAVSSDPMDMSGRYGVIKKYGYDKQAAWYLDLARDLGHPAEEFALICQMKEPPYLVTVAIIPDDELDDARARNRLALEMYRDCCESGQWPGYLPDDTAAVVSLREQDYDQEEIA